MLSATRGLASTPDQVFVTRGSQMALTLVARALIRPETSSPSRRSVTVTRGRASAWRAPGSCRCPLTVTASMSPRSNASRVPTRARRLCHAHHQFPTTVTLSAERRVRLLELARVHRMAVVEDDYDHEFHYDGRPCCARQPRPRRVVIYIGTLSRCSPRASESVCVGLPICCSGSRPTVNSWTCRGSCVEGRSRSCSRRGSATSRPAGARQYQQSATCWRTSCAGRRGNCCHSMSGRRHRHLGRRAARCQRGRVGRARVAARRRVPDARSFTFDGAAKPFARLGFASLDESELRQAVEKLLDACPAPRKS